MPADYRGGEGAVGKHSNQVVGLDIGSTKISAVVGEITPDGGLEVIGVGYRPSRGLRKGVIVDVDSAVDATVKVMEDAEVMAGVGIDGVYVGLSGGQIEGSPTEGSLELSTKEVTPRDVQQVIDTTRALTLPGNAQVLHVLPIEFQLDGAAGIANPTGMMGSKLGVWAQIITATGPAINTLLKVLDLAKVEARDIVAQPLATARAVLTEDEKNLGVVLIDIGGGSTDITIYRGGTLKFVSSLAVGGNHITHDLAVGLRTPVAEAERLKKQYGCALLTLINAEDMVNVQVIGVKEVQPTPRKLLGEIIECRVEEIFTLAFHQIQESDVAEGLAAGVVITGGASIMPGMVEAAEVVFGVPVRLGLPLYISGLTDLVNNPMYTTGVGLALYGRDYLLEAGAASPHHAGVRGALHRMAAWFQNFF
jgi:cell division protein FtsA